MGGDLALILAVVCGVAAGQTFLKLGMVRVGPVGLVRLRRPAAFVARLARTRELWVGFSLYAGSAVGWMVVLSRSDLSYAFPFMGLAYGLVPLVGVVLLGERLSRVQRLGLVLVVVGVVLVASSRGGA